MTSSEEVVRPDEEPIEFLEQTLNREVERLEERRGELAEIGEAILRLTAQVHAFAFSPRFDVGIEPVAPGMIASIIENLNRKTERIIRTSAISLEEGPGLEEPNVRVGQERIAAGLVQRALYLDTVLEGVGGKQWTRAWARAGEDQRVIRTPLSDFAVFDESSVMAVSTWGDAGSPYLLIRHPMLVRAFIALFDSAWENAVPLAHPDTGGPDDDRLLSLMALGIKDEAIARHLGWSLRTVRRRVAALMVEYGVDTRFQLGAAVARDGRVS